ncbi:hypothetical protein [Marinobacter sp. F4216]|uniref:hypothetical protein n=1 Tax=Marinobacter sp. F4216 TaxID=2874281 RepID=UPI001CBFE669|nr:hypothetical protein [Marinobacter sp. F4216]MBZ2167693.1 hypothetical protein [Marinobacter sp. F4216]
MLIEKSFKFSGLWRKVVVGTFVALVAQQVYGQETKVLLKGRYLELQGGFAIPELQDELGTPNMIWSTLTLDKLPGSTKWVFGHPAGYVVELEEPGALGTGDVSTWPELTMGRYQPVLQQVDNGTTAGAFWLDADTVLASVRKSYRSGFAENTLAAVDMNTGAKTFYSITDPNDTGNDVANFHVLQALGAGFMRVNDPIWGALVAKGNDFMLGRGGYDVLGSPLGPALGSWNVGDPHATFIIDHPDDYPARRDPYYTYPSLDPNTYDKVQLPIWKDPDAEDGFWQAGDVGGLAHINHPTVKGVVATHNHGRGVHDYRAQGDGGSGKYFLVKEPSVFYSPDSSGGNRSDHESETENQAYPDGNYARVGLVYDPADLERVAAGELQPWELDAQRFEWPKSGLPFTDEARTPTQLGGVYWDNDRQLLWVAMKWPKPAKLVAYSLVVDDSRPEEEVVIPPLFGAPPNPPKNIDMQ